MEEIRMGAIEEIFRDLDRRFLTRHAFQGTFNNEEELIRLTYIDNPEYYFVAVKKDNVWTTLESPGNFLKSEEQYSLNDLNQVRGRINNWADRIIEELTLSSKSPDEAIDQLRQNLNNYADELPNPDEPFSLEEANQWTQRLDDLVERMSQLEEESQIQRGQVNRLRREVDDLKQKILVTPKKAWVKSAGNKILNFLEVAATGAIKALAEGAVKGLLTGSN
jgi:chromosome segregation ATPase